MIEDWENEGGAIDEDNSSHDREPRNPIKPNKEGEEELPLPEEEFTCV